MPEAFDDHSPIWRQLVTILEDAVLKREILEGEPYPSVRTIAAEMGINPQTILKAFDNLQSRGLAEKRRGEGLFVAPLARGALVDERRKRLVNEEIPLLVSRAKALDMGIEGLIKALRTSAEREHT